MSQVYNCLGGSAQCGQCAHTIKQIIEQVANCSTASVAARTNLHARTQQADSPAGKVLHRRYPASMGQASVDA